MSFAGTPLGQGRRVDHSTFLGKPPSAGTSALPSYAYSAPALGSRSPPKPRPDTEDTPQANTSADDPALVRFARLKQRESAAALLAATDRPGAPKLNTTPHPEKWSVKDTSVNIATAFIQAANGNAGMSHNAAWASSSRQPPRRSTSVEYENSVSDMRKNNHRLAPPPDKLGRGAPSVRKPLSKTASVRHVPSSDNEEEYVRGKSPFEAGLNMAKQALDAATLFVRARSREPENTSGEHPTTNGHVSGNESSYSYTQEEAAFQASQRQRNLVKKGRMSTDNKAYKPSQESEEEESEYSDDGKTRRRKKSKKSGHGGPLNTLPVLTSEKRRKKRAGAKGNTTGEQEEEEEEEEVTETDILSQSMQMPPPTSTRTSVPPLSRSSAQRQSREPESLIDLTNANFTQGLDSIPEVAENLLNITVDPPTPVREPASQPNFPQRRPRSRSRSRTPAPPSRPPAAFSIGGLLGTIVRIVIKLVSSAVSLVASVMGMATFLFGQVFGTTFDLIFRRPAAWASGAGSLAKLLVPLVVALAAWYVLQDASLSSYIPSISMPTRAPVYQVPATPPADISEVAERLARIEKTLFSLSTDLERANARTQDTSKGYSDVLGRLGSLEGRISTEVRHVQDNEARARESVNRAVSAVKQEVDAIQAQIVAQQQQQQQQQKNQKPVKTLPDEETLAKLKLMESRLSSAEGAAKDALELGKKALESIPTALPAPPQPSTGTHWWSKPVAGTDGKDVPGLIKELVDSAVSMMTKDSIGKPDFALYTSGARVIPRLTSKQMEVRQRGYLNQVVGLFTGKGQFGFLPPVSALHPDLHTGQCWPFAGTQGTLGVHLAVPAYIEEITIDHVAKELALDMRTAPREMEVWGYVDGADNVARVAEWRAEREARREAGEKDVSSEPAYPADLEPGFIRLATFAYDVDATNHIQTFGVDPEVKALGVDFGIVQLRVLGNWGRREYTCLYRFRVHGKQLYAPEMPFAEEIQDGAGAEES